ncbi:Thymus-specific serine protease [Perkinsus chesapeaki]|uniref:Thymus-specific serine protease n=1 Tax=Perkinsus chesapeaki TaxID=330153 RepID=A0A7J6MJW4_PERCH|nr:Thymus-specific serine protease [Perkinsus chesapeaki]
MLRSSIAGTFKQRYLHSDKFVNGSKPELVIVDIRGEFSEDEMADFSLDVFNVGFQTQSIVVALEHRSYGKSRPNSSPTTQDLRKLLQTNQAIADLVTFREFIVKKYGLSGVKFVLMGCSYAGSLAAWARVKHPDLFLGAVASCPVINLNYDFTEYLGFLSGLFSDERIGGSPACLAFIRRASGIIKEKIATSAGRRQIESVFGLRANYLEDQKTRLLWLSSNNARFMVQSNDPYCTKDLCNIKKKCNFVAKSDTSTEQKALKVLDTIGSPVPGQHSAQDYNQHIKWLKDKSQLSDTRFNTFQSCSQWALFRSCNPGSKCPLVQDSGILGIEQAVCQDAFGISKDDVQRNIAEEMKDFGGGGLKGTRNIIVLLGGMDPWNAVGRTQTTGRGPVQYQIPLASHCYWDKAGATRLDGVKQIMRKTVETTRSWVQADDGVTPLFL